MGDAETRRADRIRRARGEPDAASRALVDRARVEGWEAVRSEVFETCRKVAWMDTSVGDSTRRRKARIMKCAETWDSLTRAWPKSERAAVRVLLGGYHGHGDCWLGKLWLNAVRATKGLPPTPDRKPVAKRRRETDRTASLFGEGAIS